MNLFLVCCGHKTDKLAIAENRGILKICSRKMIFWFAKNENYRRGKPTSLMFVNSTPLHYALESIARPKGDTASIW